MFDAKNLPNLTDESESVGHESLEPKLAFTAGLLEEDQTFRSVLDACHAVLSKKQVTTRQLRTKLEESGFEQDDIDYAIDSCTKVGILDDSSYACEWIESRLRRGHGLMRIRRDLEARGISRNIIDAAANQHIDSGDFDTAATRAIQKKFSTQDLEDRLVRSKAQRWLISRGFSYAQADTAIRSARNDRA